jgi:anti-sigma B factor antagonist
LGQALAQSGLNAILNDGSLKVQRVARCPRVCGELDISGRECVESALLAAIAGAGTDIVVDLGELTFCDSTGLSLFIIVSNQARARGSALSFANVPPLVRRLFTIAGSGETFGLSE